MSNRVDIAVVTGAGRGIGKAIALNLAKSGMHVVCISKSNNALLTQDEIMAAGGSASALMCDLCEYDSAKKIISEYLAAFANHHFSLVLAAGALGPDGPVHVSSIAEWEKTFRVNLFGNLAVYQAVVPYMLPSQWGRIVFFSGGGAAYAYPEFPAYSASKTAVIRTVENIHEDLKTKGNFAIVGLAPGAVETDMLQQVRAAGAEIKTTTDINMPVNFVKEFISAEHCAFSGRFVHVKDEWSQYLHPVNKLDEEHFWKLRRVQA